MKATDSANLQKDKSTLKIHNKQLNMQPLLSILKGTSGDSKGKFEQRAPKHISTLGKITPPYSLRTYGMTLTDQISAVDCAF